VIVLSLIHQVIKFDLAINLKTTKMLGLSMPSALLATVDAALNSPIPALYRGQVLVSK
jgi:hypothetical protein